MKSIKFNFPTFLRVLLYFCFIFLSLGQFANISRTSDLRIYLFDIFVGLYACIGIFWFLFIYKKFKIPKKLYLYILFSCIAFVSLLYKLPFLKEQELAVSSFYLLRWVMYIVATVVTYNLLEESLLDYKHLVLLVMYSGLFLAIAGFIQLAILPDFTVLDASLGWDPHKNRLASTFFDPNFLGGYLVLCLSMFLGLHFKGWFWSKKQWLMYFIIPCIALFLTFSRSAWGMFSIIILIYGVLKSKKLLIISLLIIFSALFAIPRVQTRLSGITDPADSAAFRLVSWSNTLAIAKDHLFWGVGFNAFRYAQQDYGFIINQTSSNSAAGSDSSFLFVLATTGLIGFCIFVFAFIYPMFSSVMIFTISLGLILQSQFINSLFYPQILFLYLVFLVVNSD